MARKIKVELKSPIGLVTLGPSDKFTFTSPDGLEVTSNDMEVFNAALAKLGYKEIRTTYNMLNSAGTFIIEADTPWCCDPRSEAYHSM